MTWQELSLDIKVAALDTRVTVDGRFDTMEDGLGRVEPKLDQFVDVQLRFNSTVDSRLRALEGGER